MDNWSGHHSRLFQHAINKYWANTLRIVFVPPYSPDLNWPIECSFHDAKAKLRRDRLGAPVPASSPASQVNRVAGARGPLTAAAVAATVRSVDARCNESAITLLRRARHAGYAIQQSWLCAEFDRISPAVMRH
jgi:hypothetical protein